MVSIGFQTVCFNGVYHPLQKHDDPALSSEINDTIQQSNMASWEIPIINGGFNGTIPIELWKMFQQAWLPESNLFDIF